MTGWRRRWETAVATTANGDADDDGRGDDDDDGDGDDDCDNDDDGFFFRGGDAGGHASACGRGATATRNCAPTRAVKVAAAWWAASPSPRKNCANQKAPLLRDRPGQVTTVARPPGAGHHRCATARGSSSPPLLRDRQGQVATVARPPPGAGHRCRATARGSSPLLRGRQGQVTARLQIHAPVSAYLLLSSRSG